MAWAKKNDQASALGTSNPMQTSAFSAALTNPSLIVVEVYQATAAPATPTDTAGNTYYDCGAGAVARGSIYLQIFYALNTHTTSSNKVSVANPSGYSLMLSAQEWTGGATSSPVDGYAKNANASTGTGGGQNVTSTAPGGSGTSDLLVGVANVNNGSLTIGTGFTTTSGLYNFSEYKSGVSPAAATWNDSSNSDTYSAIVAAFKAFGESIQPIIRCLDSDPQRQRGAPGRKSAQVGHGGIFRSKAGQDGFQRQGCLDDGVRRRVGAAWE